MDKSLRLDAEGREELRLILMARRAVELANTRKPRRRRHHEILMTTDMDRLMAFTTMKDFDFAETDTLPICHDPVTGTDGWATSQLLRSGEAACFVRKSGGPTILAFAADQSFADPFMGYKGEKFRARIEPHPSSNNHLVLRFESRRDFWLAPGGECLLVTPGGPSAGLIACPIWLELAKLDQSECVRYVFRCGQARPEMEIEESVATTKPAAMPSLKRAAAPMRRAA